MAAFMKSPQVGFLCVAALVVLLFSGVEAGGYGFGGGYGHDHHHYHVSHAKVAKVSYVKTPVVSTHYVKKPVVSYVSKPVKSVHYVSKPVVSVHSVPVLTKTSHSYGHGW